MNEQTKLRKGSIAWHVVRILEDNKDKPMHWQEILKRLQKEKTLQGNTPGATLLSIMIRNRTTFYKPKRGWYKLR